MALVVLNITVNRKNGSLNKSFPFKITQMILAYVPRGFSFLLYILPLVDNSFRVFCRTESINITIIET